MLFQNFLRVLPYEWTAMRSRTIIITFQDAIAGRHNAFVTALQLQPAAKMRLDLNVVHAPDIKSKQPWPRLTWLGKQQNDLLLVDSRRIKVLCLNAKSATKKKIAKLQPHLSHLIASNVSPNGAYLVCLLESGNLLIYHKDSDLLKTVPGIEQVATRKTSSSSNKTTDKTVKSSPAPLVFISSDANCILVVIGHRQLFLWEVDQSVALSSAKQPILKGTWSCVDCESATLPRAECKETSIHATFYRDSVLGFCCVCSFVFNQRSNVQISSVFLHWLEPYHLYTASQPRFTARWSSLDHPLSRLSESAEPVKHHGAFLTRHSSDGHTLAVAVNQRSPADTRVLFVSVAGSTAVSVNMKGCGCQKEIKKEKTRSYWLADIAWTHDDLFLACVTKQGCLTLLSRLGEAVLIQSSGCSIEHEPAFFLPFHPLVTFIPTGKQRSKSFSGSTRQDDLSPTSSLRSVTDEKRQRYSLAAHPTLPMLLVSDGYLVTVVELPSDLSCTGVVRDFLSEGRTAVNLLLERQGLVSRQLRSLSSLQLKRTMNGSDRLVLDDSRRAASLVSGAGQQTLTLTRDGLLSTAGSDFADYAGRFSYWEEGQFVYSDPSEMRGTRELTLTSTDGVPVIVGRAQRALLSAWGLVVSHSGAWSRRIEDLLQYTAETIVKLFSVMLQAIKHRPNDERYVSTLYAILNIFKAATSILHWDITRHHGLPTTYRLIRGTVRAISRHTGRRRLTTAVRSSISILQYCEKLLTNIYTLVGVHQPTLYGLNLYPYHWADIVESALMCRESVRVRGLVEVDDHMTGAALRPEEVRGGHQWRQQRQEMEGRGIVVRHSPAKRLIQTWKLLHRHLVARYQKLVRDSSTHRGRGVRRVLLLLCGVQMKLKQLDCEVALSLCDEWSRRIDAGFLRGCQYYLQGYPEEAVACWHQTADQTTQLQNQGSAGLPSNRYFPGPRTQFPIPGSSVLLSHSLLAIAYTHLEQYNLTAALSLVDSLIECYGVEMVGEGRSRKKEAGRWHRLTKSKASFLGWRSQDGEVHPRLPCVPDPVQREAVQSLARFMSLYFTNHSLFVYPPCAARPLPPLHHKPQENGTSRTVPIYHDRVSSNVRQQQLSDIWTADTAMALLLVCGLLPEAVWLARELGDWKSALMLSVMASQQMEVDIASSEDSNSFELLCLPENLTPLVIVKEGISVILQTPLTPRAPGGGSSVRRNSSFNEQDRRGSHSLSVSGSMRRSSSMCSINEEDRIMQEQLCRSLTDMFTAATVANLDPTPWLLRNLMDRCLSLVAEFNTLVPEEFYLPAPPFYCPQPDYEPKDSDPEEVLFESSLRREVNDVIQLIMLVLNSAKCSLPCARWYVQQLDLLLTLDARKKKIPAVPLPSVLVDHARFPVDLLKTGIDSQSLPQCTLEVLQVFRDLCSTVWMLHSRDKLTLAVRKYQASRERSLRVKPQNNAEVAKHSELLEDILMWADNLHPFTAFLNLEEEVQDILLTAISELPPTRETVAVLARHFHGNLDNLSPLLQEKFQRLTTKLKWKREKSDRKSTKKSAEVGKENKRVVKYETLHQQYRYQCKLRQLTVSNRREEIGMCELQVFEELSERDPSKEEGDRRDAHGHKSETASSSAKKNQSTADGTSATISKQADAQYPIVGSREFESSPGYLDFLETFFLVAFGKIVQDNAPFTSKPKLPLIGAYSSELRQKEFGSVVRRMSVNTKLLTVELDPFSLVHKSSLQTAADSSAEVKGFLDGEVPEKFIKSRSMFHHKADRMEEDQQLIALKKYSSRSSLNSVMDPSKEKHMHSQKSKGELPSSKQGILQPYSSVVLNLGEAYRSQAEMLQWFGRWAERQLAVYAQTPEQGDESKVVLRVRLPQQLVLNSLWLVHHLYHPDLFEVLSVPESSDTVMTEQGGSVNPPKSLRVHRSKPEQPLPGSLRKGQRRTNQDKINFEDPGTDRSRKAKPKRTSKKTASNFDSDSEKEEPRERRRRSDKKARIQRNVKEKKLKEVRSDSLDEVRPEEVHSERPRKKRQLPEVTEAHRKTSPRRLTADKEVVKQLLLRAQSPDAVKEVRRISRGDEMKLSDLSDGSITTVSIVRSRTANHQEDSVPESSRRSDHPRKSKSKSISKRGILTNEVFYYSDSDTSTLDISSLEEAEGTTNWLVDSKNDTTASPVQEDIRREDTPSPQPETAGKSSKSLKLDMKDEDVKKLVREEFMRMMEKNKSSSWSLPDRNPDKNPASSDSSRPLRVGAKEQGMNSDAIQPEEQPVSNKQPSKSESITQSGTTASKPVNRGTDVETQVPSPLMQTWHGDGRHPSSPHRDQLSQGVSRETRRDLRNAGVGLDAVQSEQASTGLNRSEPVQSTGFERSDFRPDLHSTPYDARNTDNKSTVSGRLAPMAGDDEPLMSPLHLEDLESKDDVGANPYAPPPTAYPIPPTDTNSTHPGDRPNYVSSASFASTFRHALHLPLLLTVPQERLAQGQIGTAGVRYPPPPQMIGPSQSVAPPLSSRGVRDNSQQPHDPTYHQRNPEPYGDQYNSRVAQVQASAVPKTAQATPHQNHSFIPPLVSRTAYENPVRHLVSLLHPGTQQQQQHSGGGLPPIQLLHLPSRHPASIIPPPSYPVVPTSNPPNSSANAYRNPTEPIPLLQLKTDSKPSQFVPLEELNAFERKQRWETEKHPAVRAREAREQLEGGKGEEKGRGPETVAPIPLLHAELRNDLGNTTRQRRRQQQDKKPVTTETQDRHLRETPDATTQDRRDVTILPKDQPHPGDKQQSRREDTQQSTEEGNSIESKETVRVPLGRKVGQDSKAKTRVVLVASTKEEEVSQDTAEKQELSSEFEETDSEEGEEKEAKDATMRREELWNGYAIKPGTFDAVLQDRDARSALPTAAQVHYDTVRQLQAKPKSDASTSMKQTKSVATSMGKDDFPRHPPTIADATSQYTAAATRLANTGQIVAPDIFFNLRFGTTPSDQQPSLHGKETSKDSMQPSKGRTFISVVDVELKDLPNLEPHPKGPQPPPLGPSSLPALPTKEQPPDPVAPSPTNAELHYNALFLKDAHPKKTPPKVQFDDEAETGGGPDAVTLKVLDGKMGKSSFKVAQSKARSESARQSTKEKLNQRLAQMDQQLNAIEESAANIEQDFRNTSLMLHTVENLADAMTPSDTRPMADYSLRDYRSPDQVEAEGPDVLDAQAHDDSMRSQESRPVEEQQEDDKDGAGGVTMVTDEEADVTGTERGDDTAFTLGISGISGVSDIIAEVIADGNASDVREMGVSTQQQRAARKKMDQRRMTEQPGVEDYTRLSSDQIRELLATPLTPRQDEDEGDRWPSKRKPAERTEKERKELKEWAAMKRAKNLAEYKKQREELKERERRPYRPETGEAMGTSSVKIRKQEEERDKKKKGMMESSHNERVLQAKALMAEIFTERPQLPTEEAPPPTKRRDRSLRDSAASEMSSRLEKRPGSQIPKGTYLFVDSGVYMPRPLSRSQGGVDGRVDSRASRGQELGYPGEWEDGEVVGGRWTGTLGSEDRGSRGLTSEDRERRNQETRDSKDWRFLEGIAELTDNGQVSVDSQAHREPAKLYRPKPFDQVVRVQRPEVTRKQPGSVRTQKTYTNMLQEMKGESGRRKTSSKTLRAKQRLYGTKRIPGSSKPADSTTPRATKTYSERLSDMQQKTGGMTRLRPRPRPKGVPRINTGTLTLGTFDDTPYRRQQIEGRGLHPEPTPRSSTPYHERVGTLSLSGTYKGRDDVVSPAPKVGVKYKPRDREPTTYVERLQRLSSEAPLTHRHKTAYVGPVQRDTYKSPRLHSPTARHRPYPRQGQSATGVEEFDERSGFSDLSSWNVSDDVMNILQRRDSFDGDVGATTDDDVSIGGLEYDYYTTAVNIRELEEIASVSSGSVLSNIDWGAVDKMIADVR